MKKIIDKTKENLVKIILIMFLITFIWTISNSILEYEIVMYIYNPVIVVVGIAIFLILLIIIWKKIIPKISEYKYLPIVLILLFAIISFVVGLNMKVSPTWDMGSVFKIAEGVAKGCDIDAEYVYKFPNNLMLTGIYTIVFKLVLMINITDLVTVATCFNALIIIGTVVFTYLVVRELYGKEKALFLLIITLFTTPLYLQVPIYYSDSMSMFLTILMLYLLIKTIQKEKNIIWQILLAIVTFVAMQVKITSIILIIAAVMFAFIKGFKLKDVKKILVSLIVFVVLFAGYKIIENRIFDKARLDALKYPIEHWFMMGLEGNGIFNEGDYSYTTSFPTYDEKKEADMKVIEERLSAYNTDTFVKHITEKLKFTYSDGTYFAPNKLSREPVEKNVLHDIILTNGKYSNYYKYLPQVMHYTMLILMTVSSFVMLSQKKYKEKELIFILSILGITVFLLLWENRSRYILTFLPIMMILQLYGFEYIVKRYDERKENK